MLSYRQKLLRNILKEVLYEQYRFHGKPEKIPYCEEFDARRAAAVPREPNIKSGWLYRYSKMVAPSAKGAVMMED